MAIKIQKWIFLEALLVTIVVFVLGILIGVSFESGRINEMNDYYMTSEVSLTDIIALNQMVDLGYVDCAELKKTNLDFADRIYSEAKLLEQYEEAGQISDNIQLVHKKYDLLRTFLWINLIHSSEQCGKNSSYVIYLYNYGEEDLNKKATQSVWSKYLEDLKEEMGEDLILVPIASNTGLDSLDALIKKNNISEFPVVIANKGNDSLVIRDMDSLLKLKDYLK
jgi:hypothetical protein